MKQMSRSDTKLARLLTLATMVIMLGWGARPAKCQEVALDSIPKLPSLEVIINQAKLFAPSIAERRALVRKNEEEVNRVSKNWLDGISIGVQSTAGSYGNRVIDEVNVGMQTSVSIRFSLFDIFSQQDQNKIAAWGLQISREMVRKAEVDEIQVIVRLYNLVDESRQQVTVRADSWRSAQVHREMADIEFTNGDITIAELARVSEIEAKSKSDYISATSAYRSWYGQLEVRIGIRLSELN